MPKKKAEKFPNRYVPLYLIDPANGTYEEYNLAGMQKRLGVSDTFISKRVKSEELFILNGRGYYLTSDFGRVWELL